MPDLVNPLYPLQHQGHQVFGCEREGGASDDLARIGGSEDLQSGRIDEPHDAVAEHGDPVRRHLDQLAVAALARLKLFTFFDAVGDVARYPADADDHLVAHTRVRAHVQDAVPPVTGADADGLVHHRLSADDACEDRDRVIEAVGGDESVEGVPDELVAGSRRQQLRRRVHIGYEALGVDAEHGVRVQIEQRVGVAAVVAHICLPPRPAARGRPTFAGGTL